MGKAVQSRPALDEIDELHHLHLPWISGTHSTPFINIIEAEWRIYASFNWAFIGSDNGLSPVRHQAII